MDEVQTEVSVAGLLGYGVLQCSYRPDIDSEWVSVAGLLGYGVLLAVAFAFRPRFQLLAC